MAWIKNEARALKKKFDDITVMDANDADRPVEARFRSPEYEVSNRTYPSIFLDFTNIARDPEREHRGQTRLGYIPEGKGHSTTGDPADRTVTGISPVSGLTIEFDDGMPPNYSPLLTGIPIPYNIDFQVMVYSRLQNHLMEIVAELSRYHRIPERGGYVEVVEDNTIRSLFILGGPELSSALDEDGKRLFTATYICRVATELLEEEVEEVVKWVQTVNLDLDTI